MSNVIDYYESFGEREWSRLDREPLELLVNLHYIKEYLPTSGAILDNGAGPGKYSMELAKLGYNITLTDLTPKFVHLAAEKSEELGLSERFSGFHVLNAENLIGIEDNTFDASLMLGPLYHIQDENGRINAVKELFRVTKPKGIVFVAFRSRINHVLDSLLRPENWKPNNSIDNIQEFMETGVFNHEETGRFTGAYFYNLEDIKPFMESNGFETLQLIGSTNLGFSLNKDHWSYWNNKGEYNKLIDLLIETACDPSVLGLSSHLLYIGRKKG